MLDPTDKKLVNLLHPGSKQTTKQLSLRLNFTATAVYKRVKKLENQKGIEKYVAIINKNKIEKYFLVFCHIKLIQHAK
jgi:Lrp/AsnC family leucine-responsive transcriptional regulator